MSINQALCREIAAPAPIRTGAIMSFLATAVLRAVCTIQVWRDRARQRRMLASLDDRMLKDIGIDRMSARMEANKPFWRP